MIKKITRNSFLIFLPFLVYYIFNIIGNRAAKLFGDEPRYMEYAKNLLHGFYSKPAPHVNLWNGPGYPITLMPFVALHASYLYMALINALYQYVAVVFLYKSLRMISNIRISLIFSVLMAFYPNAVSMLSMLYTEPLTVFLISTFIFCLTLYHKRAKGIYIILAGLTLGFLVLTKIIFGYVVVLCAAGYLIGLLINRRRVFYLQSAKILLIGFVCTLPYLAYTYHLTGKLFYWGNSGGLSLYWMSTPNDGEYGDWKMPTLSNNQYPNIYNPSVVVVNLLKKHHKKEIDAIEKGHDDVKQNELYKQAAIANIKSHPWKFVQNYGYNFSRMLFNFPYSYSYQEGAITGNIIRGSLIMWASIIGMVLTVLNWRRMISPVKLAITITTVYLLLSGALSAYPRQLDVMMPVLLFWIGFLAFNLKKPKLHFAGEENLENIELGELSGIEISSTKTTGEPLV